MALVLVTGATGEVARGVLPYLEKHFDLRLLSLDPPGEDPRRVQADILDWDALARAMNGVDAVLHLAVASGHSGTFEEDAFNDRRFDVNVKGTFHVFATAERLRIRRVVYVSSVMATWGYGLQSREGIIRGDAAAFPVGTYALTKALGEEIALYFATRADVEEPGPNLRRGPPPLEVITLRIAGPLNLDDPEVREKLVRPQQVPFPDLAQSFWKALTVPLRGYRVVTIAGRSSKTRWDLRPAKRVLGYRPQYNLDDLGLKFADPFDVPQV
jgi:uronate dehydrogenase